MHISGFRRTILSHARIGFISRSRQVLNGGRWVSPRIGYLARSSRVLNGGRWVSVLIICSISLLLSNCSGSATQTTSSGAVGNLSSSLGWLHVYHPKDSVPYIVDQYGRRIILRGVAASGFEDQAYRGAIGTIPNYPINPNDYNGKCPVNNGRAPDPPLCEVQAAKPANSQSSSPFSQDDFAQMRAFGFNVVRLTLSWSLLEPTPGYYSTQYLARISQVVNWARQQGIYVILDMHQDQYSRFLVDASRTTPNPPGCSSSNGQDGAPLWAVVTDNKPSCSLLGQNELNPAMAAAFENFWENDSLGNNNRPIPQGKAPGVGLQDHYIGALAALANRFENNSTVLGYELMNEPLPGALPTSTLPVSNLYNFSDSQLYPFYRRAIEALTGVRDGLKTCPASYPSPTSNGLTSADIGSPNSVPLHPLATSSTSSVQKCAYPKLASVSKQLILFEPTGYNNLADFAPQVSRVFSSYNNLVFSPHVYTHVFTADTFPGATGTYPPSFSYGYQNAMYEASAMHAAVLATEFGDPPSHDNSILSNMVAAQEMTLTSSIFWTWKENCGSPSTTHCQNGWGVYQPPDQLNGIPVDQNGKLYPSRQKYLDIAWPIATQGSLIGYIYSPANKSLELKATSYGAVPTSDYSRQTEIRFPQNLSNNKALENITGPAKVSKIVKLPDNSGELIFIDPTGPGTYTFTQLSQPLQTSSTSNQLAWLQDLSQFNQQIRQPLQPLSEVEARSIFDAWIAKQPSPIFKALVTILLGPVSVDPNLQSSGNVLSGSGKP